MVLSGLVDSLFSLIKSLSPVSKNFSVNTVTLAPTYAVNPSAAAVSEFKPVVFSAVPGEGLNVESQKELPDPESLQMTVRYNVPEVCMKDAMPCEISPLGYHLSVSVKEKI